MTSKKLKEMNIQEKKMHMFSAVASVWGKMIVDCMNDGQVFVVVIRNCRRLQEKSQSECVICL